jgi:hypothetical protein
MKRLEFATNHGFNIQTLNDPRYSQTIHIWFFMIRLISLNWKFIFWANIFLSIRSKKLLQIIIFYKIKIDIRLTIIFVNISFKT